MPALTRSVLILCSFLAGCIDPMLNSSISEENTFNPDYGYKRFYSPAAYNFSYVFAEQGAPIRWGNRSERYELRDGDCGGSDCGNPRYRAEIQQPSDGNPARVGQDTWYAWSFLNQTVPSFTRQESLRLVFGQWTMGQGATPVIRLIQLGKDEGNWESCKASTCAGSATDQGDVVVQLADMNSFLNWGEAKNNGYVCRLFDMRENKNRWVDLIMNTNFSNTNDGYLRVWVNGQLKCNYSGPIVSSDSLSIGEGVVNRRGIFSSYTSRWTKTYGDRIKPTLVVQYDEFAVGTSRDKVDPVLRSQAGKRAFD